MKYFIPILIDFNTKINYQVSLFSTNLLNSLMWHFIRFSQWICTVHLQIDVLLSRTLNYSISLPILLISFTTYAYSKSKSLFVLIYYQKTAPFNKTANMHFDSLLFSKVHLTKITLNLLFTRIRLCSIALLFASECLSRQVPLWKHTNYFVIEF